MDKLKKRLFSFKNWKSLIVLSLVWDYFIIRHKNKKTKELY